MTSRIHAILLLAAFAIGASGCRTQAPPVFPGHIPLPQASRPVWNCSPQNPSWTPESGADRKEHLRVLLELARPDRADPVRAVNPPVAQAARLLYTGQWDQALPALKEWAEANDPDALVLLGQARLHGMDGPINATGAALCFQQAAALGSPSGKGRLGLLLHNGTGLPKDRDAALALFHQAAEGGDGGFQFLLYELGASAAANTEHADAALCHLLRAASNADAWAMWTVGRIHDEVLGLPEDRLKALYWYWRSAQTGFPLACMRIASMYEEGHMLEKSLDNALAWYRVAADNLYIPAMQRLATHYENGTILSQDPEAALFWLETMQALDRRKDVPGLKEARAALTTEQRDRVRTKIQNRKPAYSLEWDSPH